METITGENMRPVTWVIVEDVNSGECGIRGKALGAADVKALAAGKLALQQPRLSPTRKGASGPLC